MHCIFRKQVEQVLKKLKNKIRLVVINDDTYEEHFSFKLSVLNIINTIGIFTLILLVLVIVFIALTPIRQYIPGYSNIKTKKDAAYAYYKADSLENELHIQRSYIKNIRSILSGELIPDSLTSGSAISETKIKHIKDLKSIEDSIMRVKIEKQEEYSLSSNQQNKIKDRIYLFFTPVKGTLIDGFDAKKKHFGTDIVTEKGETIKSVMNGTIILSDYTTKSGFVIQIQHPNNLVSIYKHCSAVLKQVGESVNAGDPIALVGNTGLLTTGPHLHLELWENGIPVAPENSLNFNARNHRIHRWGFTWKPWPWRIWGRAHFREIP